MTVHKMNLFLIMDGAVDLTIQGSIHAAYVFKLQCIKVQFKCLSSTGRITGMKECSSGLHISGYLQILSGINVLILFYKLHTNGSQAYISHVEV